jgi:acyl carrier protein
MGLDSVELVIAVEETFGCRITDEQAERIVTPRELIDCVLAMQQRGELFITPEPKPVRWFGKVRPSVRLEKRDRTREEIAVVVRELIRENLGVDQFDDNDRFIEDLGMDR